MTHKQTDLTGEKLKGQRFQMLEDIARELSGNDVVFPTCFDLAMRIRKALQNDDQPIGKVVDLLAQEPLIGTKLLHLANSTAYNPSGNTIRDLKSAISRLGLETVRATAMAVTMNQMLRARSLASFEEMAVNLWRHTIQTASATYVVAKNLSRINPDEAMMAGLVHDIGAFYMLYRAAQYEELRDRPDTVKYLIVQWHESIGLSVLAALGMSDELIEAVRDHDVLRVAPDKVRTMNDVVYVGNMLAGGRFEWMHQDIDPHALDEYALGEVYTSLKEEVQARAADMQGAFI